MIQLKKNINSEVHKLHSQRLNEEEAHDQVSGLMYRTLELQIQVQLSAGALHASDITFGKNIVRKSLFILKIPVGRFVWNNLVSKRILQSPTSVFRKS